MVGGSSPPDPTIKAALFFLCHRDGARVAICVAASWPTCNQGSTPPHPAPLLNRGYRNISIDLSGNGVNQELWLIPVARFQEGFPPRSCRCAAKLDISYLTRRLSFFALLEETPEILPRLHICRDRARGCVWVSFHRTIPEPTRTRPDTNLLTQSQLQPIVARPAL